MSSSTPTEFIPVAKTTEVPPTGRLVVEVQERMVVVVRIQGEYYCLDDMCTHDGGTLGDGELDDHCLVCPRHGAKFDVRTGEPRSMPATEPTATHDIQVRGDTIWIRLNDNF